MVLKRLEISGFKSFAQKTQLEFAEPVVAIVGPNGSGKSNVAEAFRFVLGEQSLRSMRGKRGEDMIFGGSPQARRSNRATVSLTFNNTDRRFSGIDFDEVYIERTVHRDGENDYSINGSRARLKDVLELLSAVHIGASAHHIISQGETDRILNAKPLERRSMIEEALGLKVYQYKKKESEKKLLKTEDNLKEVRSVRRELAPRIEYLKDQVDKIERARHIQDELTGRYREFLKREYVYITHTARLLEEGRREPELRLREIEEEIQTLKDEISREEEAQQKNSQVLELEEAARELDLRRGELMRDTGRLEGEIASRHDQLRREREREYSDARAVPWKDVSTLVSDIQDRVEEAQRSTSLDAVKQLLTGLTDRITGFVDHFRYEERHASSALESIERSLRELEEEKQRKDQALAELKEEIERTSRRRAELAQEAHKDQSASREAERRMFECMNTRNELKARLERIGREEQDLQRIDALFKGEVQDAARLVGSFVLDYKEQIISLEDGTSLSDEDIFNEPREEQEERRRQIERLKIRLEELGVGSQKEILEEYEEITERDEFLAREVADLEHSIESLRSVIADLEATMQREFEEGLSKINSVFQEFFADMFGGGKAALVRVHVRNRSASEEDDEEDDYSEGLEIRISLPRKNISSLMMLSGGERSLTSIALIFAMSQVNPPPFLILDETDAALDEANSQKYGAMLERLSAHSQLIVITHNRETMARAGVLYGVTMDSSGASRLLSVQLGASKEPAAQNS